MTTIQNPFSRINTRIGNKQGQSVGEGLAGILSASLQAYGKVKEIDKQFNEEQDAKLSESEMIAYNSTLKKMRDEDVANNASAMTPQEYAIYKREQRSRLSKKVNKFESTWSKKKSSDLVSVFDAGIAKADIAYQKELKSSFINEQVPEFAKTVVYGTEEFDNMYNAIASFKTGETFTKEDFVSIIADSNSAYMKEIANKVNSGDLNAFNEKEIEAIKNNTLEYIKNPKIRAKVEESYRVALNTYKTQNGNKLEEDNFELLYGNNALSYTNKHKALYNSVKDREDIDDTTKKRIISTITTLKKASLSAGSSVNKKLVKKIEELSKQTFGNGEKEKELGTDLNNDSLKNIGYTKSYVSKLLTGGNYSELNSMLQANGTISDGDTKTVFPYKKDLVKNQLNLYVQDVEASLEGLNRTDSNYRIKLQEIKRIEASLDGVKSSIGTNAIKMLEDTNQGFTSIDEVHKMIDYATLYTSDNDRGSGLLRVVGNTLKNQIETLKEQYGYDEEKKDPKIKSKILLALNRIKNDTIVDYENELKITDEKLEKFDTIQPLMSSDIQKESFTGNLGYFMRRWKKDNPNKKFEVTEENLDDLLNYAESWSPKTEFIDGDVMQSLGRVAKFTAGVFVEGFDRILLPPRRAGNRPTIFENVMNKIVGETITYKNKDYKIPSYDNLNVRIIDDNHIQILDRSTGSLIFDMNDRVAYDIADIYGIRK